MIDYAQRHVQFGWWSLLVFATAGLVLESFHGFKVRAYLDVSNETRRLMWTLAHAHGTLLALVHVVFGLTVRSGLGPPDRALRPISFAMIAASVLLPGGFFLGGIAFFGGDPGLGILVVPLAAALLLWTLFSIASSRRG